MPFLPPSGRQPAQVSAFIAGVRSGPRATGRFAGGRIHARPPSFPIRWMWAPMRADELISSQGGDQGVLDFEWSAARNVAAAHFGYMASGIGRRGPRGAPIAGSEIQAPPAPAGGRQPSRHVDRDPRGVKYAKDQIVIAPVGGQRSSTNEGEVRLRARRQGRQPICKFCRPAQPRRRRT